ncbi:MAG: hypothetical protein AB1730_05320 [Myxococcota bacterium]
MPDEVIVLQIAFAPRLAWHSDAWVQESPIFLVTTGVWHILSVHSWPTGHAMQATPPEPQLFTVLPATQVPLGRRQPVQLEPPPVPPPVPPPEPPPVPPPAPPPVLIEPQVLVVALHTWPDVVQSAHWLPPEPQVVLRLLFGFATHLPAESQQPSLQLLGPHLLPPHDGANATTKPITVPSARALRFMKRLPCW